MKQRRVGVRAPGISLFVKISWIDASDVIRAKDFPIHDVSPFSSRFGRTDFSRNAFHERPSRLKPELQTFGSGASLRVIGQCSLVTKHRVRPYQGRASDMATAADDCPVYLRCRSNAGVRPDN